MTVGPHHREQRQQPQFPAGFQNGDEEPGHEERDQRRPVHAELGGDGGGSQRGHQAIIEISRAARGYQSSEAAKTGQQQSLEKHDSREAGRAVDRIHNHLRQPFVREVEVAYLLLARVHRLTQIGGERERIGDGQGTVLNDVLAGFEMPPEIGIGDFGGEQAGQAKRGQQQNRHSQPVGLGDQGAGGAVTTASRRWPFLELLFTR